MVRNIKVDKKKILLAMARMRISDSDLCKKSGVSKNTIGRIKAGKFNPKPATLGKLAYALDLDPEDIIDEKE